MVSSVHEYARAFGPATVANVGVGFDVLGFALGDLGDRVELRACKTREVHIVRITGDGGRLSRDPHKNTAGVVVQQFLERINASHGVEITLHKALPLGSGLGSSAASAAAALVGVNALFGNPLTKAELVPIGMEGERVACGSAHADNIAPSILGGIILVRSYHPLDVLKLPCTPNFYCTVVTPNVEVRTEDARRAMPTEVPLSTVVTQLGNLAGLMVGLLTNDLPLITRSLEDRLAEPYRSPLIPGFAKARAAALEHGASAFNISGSGPSLFVLSSDEAGAYRVRGAIEDALLSEGIGSRSHVTSFNMEGAIVEESA
jgi:homoserine kinase